MNLKESIEALHRITSELQEISHVVRTEAAIRQRDLNAQEQHGPEYVKLMRRAGAFLSERGWDDDTDACVDVADFVLMEIDRYRSTVKE